MRTLIIPDVHLKIDRVKKIIEQNQFDELVSLGDWFDDFYDTIDMARETAEYLVELQNTYGDKFIWLLGNHDVPYVFSSVADAYWCSGNTTDKMKCILQVFNGRLSKSTPKLVHIISIKGLKKIYLSHAGLCKEHFANPMDDISEFKFTPKIVNERCQRALLNCDIGITDNLFRAGRARYGPLPYGGVTWLDWYAEFSPIKGISQIVGHTPLQGNPMIIDDKSKIILPDTAVDGIDYLRYTLKPNKTFNINMDTHLNNYAILADGMLEVHQYDAFA